MKRIAPHLAVFSVCSFVPFILSLPGCGDGRPRRVPVSGRVMIDGKPLAAGFVQVYPDTDRAAFGAIGPDGRFRLTTYDVNDGCVLGKHRLAVIGREDKSPGAVMWLAPKKYTDPRSSGLELEVTGPTDNVEIELAWEGGKPFLERMSGGGDEGMSHSRRK